jgi:hypothetical protein
MGIVFHAATKGFHRGLVGKLSISNPDSLGPGDSCFFGYLEEFTR